ncbi:hypothetical protein D9M72_629900 [compost metagenome]
MLAGSGSTISSSCATLINLPAFGAIPGTPVTAFGPADANRGLSAMPADEQPDETSRRPRNEAGTRYLKPETVVRRRPPKTVRLRISILSNERPSPPGNFPSGNRP